MKDIVGSIRSKMKHAGHEGPAEECEMCHGGKMADGGMVDADEDFLSHDDDSTTLDLDESYPDEAEEEHDSMKGRLSDIMKSIRSKSMGKR